MMVTPIYTILFLEFTFILQIIFPFYLELLSFFYRFLMFFPRLVYPYFFNLLKSSRESYTSFEL
jgi:hypothetical protein